jgi:RND family efflux transporter MFP subunit
MLSGCGEAPQEVIEEVARPVKSIVVSSPQGEGLRYFPGRVDSANKAELSFRVPGTVERILIQEGELVDKGQLLAQLDDADYSVIMSDRQARWDRSKKDYDRGLELVKDGSISRSDFDKVEANFKSNDASREQARLNLEYTNLRAPFAGSIARRHVEQFEETQAMQTVFSLIDEGALLVKVDVPENLILALPGGDRRGEGSPAKVSVSFDTAKEMSFPLQYREASSRADAKTQTFEVTFDLPRPEGLTVLPGMSASVTVDASDFMNVQAVYSIPISAVTGNGTLNPRIWRVDETSMTVHEQAVTVGRMIGSRVEITSGVETGTRIVTAGAAFLSEGMKVTLMTETEQARPRDDEDKSSDV